MRHSCSNMASKHAGNGSMDYFSKYLINEKQIFTAIIIYVQTSDHNITGDGRAEGPRWFWDGLRNFPHKRFTVWLTVVQHAFCRQNGTICGYLTDFDIEKDKWKGMHGWIYDKKSKVGTSCGQKVFEFLIFCKSSRLPGNVALGGEGSLRVMKEERKHQKESGNSVRVDDGGMEWWEKG